MIIQNVFSRYEIKYMLNNKLKQQLLEEIEKHMHIDQFGKSLICNVYYDTKDYLLIRKSLDKPIYKEKLRVRSYGVADNEKKVYVELKKKYNKVVYKRRVQMNYQDVFLFLKGQDTPSSQIESEISYFTKYYHNLEPSVYLSYEREAYYSDSDRDLRITFDNNILWRTDDITLERNYGNKLLDDDQVLMEVKVASAMPMWLTSILSKYHIYKTSFSKYGNIYQTILREGRKVYA